MVNFGDIFSMNGLSFVITTIGTGVGIVALVMTIKINNKTNRIQREIRTIETKATFKYRKEKVLNNLKKSYKEYQKNGHYKYTEIEEAITDLDNFNDVYTEKFKSCLIKLKQNLSYTKGEKPFPNAMDETMKYVYEVISRLENDLSVIKIEEGVI